MSDQIEEISSKEIAAGEPATEATAPEGLSLQDLVAIKEIVDLASSRGAFKPEEMVAVGTIYNKFVTFLKAAIEASKENENG